MIDVGDGRGIARASTTISDGNVPSIAAENMYVVDDLVVNDAFGLYLILSASKSLTLDKPATRTITRLKDDKDQVEGTMPTRASLGRVTPETIRMREELKQR